MQLQITVNDRRVLQRVTDTDGAQELSALHERHRALLNELNRLNSLFALSDRHAEQLSVSHRPHSTPSLLIPFNLSFPRVSVVIFPLNHIFKSSNFQRGYYKSMLFSTRNINYTVTFTWVRVYKFLLI